MRRLPAVLIAVHLAACASTSSATDEARRRERARRLDETPAEARQDIPWLLAAMSDPDWEVRWRAELALGRVGREGVPGLVEGLASADTRIRLAAAYVIGPMGGKAKAAVPRLLE